MLTFGMLQISASPGNHRTPADGTAAISASARTPSGSGAWRRSNSGSNTPPFYCRRGAAVHPASARSARPTRVVIARLHTATTRNQVLLILVYGATKYAQTTRHRRKRSFVSLSALKIVHRGTSALARQSGQVFDARSPSPLRPTPTLLDRAATFLCRSPVPSGSRELLDLPPRLR